MASTIEPTPIRKNKRSSDAISPAKPTHTPSRKRPQKKARFFDTDLPSATATTTGITPFVGKVTLRTPKRRASTPAPSTRYHDTDTVQFTPLRQCLDERVKRRIRRHGLSDEMNSYVADKKTNAELRRQIDAKDAELKRLRQELEASRSDTKADDGFEALNASQARVDEVEAEIEQLRRSFGLFDEDDEEEQQQQQLAAQLHADVPTLPPSVHEDSAVGFQIYEDADADADADENPLSDDIEALAVGLDFQAAREGKQALFRSSHGSASSSFAFEDSPMRPSRSRDIPPSPNSLREHLSKELSAALTRAEDAELALHNLNTEIQALGFASESADARRCVSAIAQHFRQMRLDLERVIPGEIAGSFSNATLMPETIKKIKLVAQHVRDREAELKSMRAQQRALKGNFDHAIAAAAHAESKITDLEATVDRNAEDMLALRMRAQELERELAAQESSNASLIVAIEKYRLEATRLEDLVRLIEAEHATRIEEIKRATAAEFDQQTSDLDARLAAETTGRRAAEESAVDRLRKINHLETALTSARQHADDVRERLHSLESQLHDVTAQHEREVGSLNARTASLGAALACANAEVDKLRTINGKLEERYLNEVQQGSATVERMQHEYIRAVARMAEEKKRYVRGAKVRYANWEIESDGITSDDMPVTPASLVRFADLEDLDADAKDQDHVTDHDGDDHVPGSVEIGRGKERRSKGGMSRKRGRRRYDSGIGMDSVSEAEEESGSSNIDGPLTPSLSSEPDVEQDTDVELPLMA